MAAHTTGDSKSQVNATFTVKIRNITASSIVDLVLDGTPQQCSVESVQKHIAAHHPDRPRVELQLLIHGGKTLDPTKLLSAYDIQHNSVIFLCIKSEYKKAGMDIAIQSEVTSLPKTFQIQTESSDTVGSVLNTLAMAVAIPTHMLLLVSPSGHPMTTLTQSLCDYHVMGGATLRLLMIRP